MIWCVIVLLSNHVAPLHSVDDRQTARIDVNLYIAWFLTPRPDLNAAELPIVL